LGGQAFHHFVPIRGAERFQHPIQDALKLPFLICGEHLVRASLEFAALAFECCGWKVPK
jgi:hypothetical protein